MGRISREIWLLMRKDYEEGIYDLGELAVSQGLRIDTLKRRAKEEGWKRPESDRTLRRLKKTTGCRCWRLYAIAPWKG